jgi:hypothetical protein
VVAGQKALFITSGGPQAHTTPVEMTILFRNARRCFQSDWKHKIRPFNRIVISTGA